MGDAHRSPRFLTNLPAGIGLSHPWPAPHCRPGPRRSPRPRLLPCCPIRERPAGYPSPKRPFRLPCTLDHCTALAARRSRALSALGDLGGKLRSMHGMVGGASTWTNAPAHFRAPLIAPGMNMKNALPASPHRALGAIPRLLPDEGAGSPGSAPMPRKPTPNRQSHPSGRPRSGTRHPPRGRAAPRFASSSGNV